MKLTNAAGAAIKRPKTVAVIPAYNEEVAIGSVVILTSFHVDKVIVVDDGSSDRTAEIAHIAGAEVIRHKQNRGYGAALKTGFEEARRQGAEVMVVLDADGQHNPKQIPNLTLPIRKGEADITLGSRFLKNGSAVPAYRKFGIGAINLLTNVSAHGNVTDSQCGFRAYSKKALKLIDLKEKDMAASVEILLQAKKHHLRIKEVATEVRYDVGKHSQHPLVHGLGVIAAIIRITGEKHPLLTFGLGGLLISLVGLFLGWHTLDVE